MPVTSGHPPRRSSAFFFILPLRTAIKHTCVCVCVFITVMENLCHYTPEPLSPQPQHVRALGLRVHMQHFPDGGHPL
jgi:hypothetical protein